MCAVILCQAKRAETPYYVNDTGTNLYSAEELCWYMEHNLPLLARVFFEEPLQEWMRKELKLDRLADILRSRQNAGRAPLLEELALPVFDEISWLAPDEREAVRRQLDDLERMPEPARRKLRADMLADYRKYMPAIMEYRDILKDPAAGTQLCGELWHNMGVSYARMFQMDEAGGCFRKAWEILKSRTTLRNYLCCSYLQGGREAFDRIADECGADMAFREELEESVMRLTGMELPPDLDAALRGWIEEYHRETGL